jgi:hypothetical protein
VGYSEKYNKENGSERASDLSKLASEKTQIPTKQKCKAITRIFNVSQCIIAVKDKLFFIRVTFNVLLTYFLAREGKFAIKICAACQFYE